MDNLCIHRIDHMVYLTPAVAQKIINGDTLSDSERVWGGIFKCPAHTQDLPAFDITWVDGEVKLTSDGNHTFTSELFELLEKLKTYMAEVADEMGRDVYKGYRGEWTVDWKNRQLIFKSEGDRVYVNRMKWLDNTPTVDLEEYAKSCCIFPADAVAINQILKDAETKLPR